MNKFLGVEDDYMSNQIKVDNRLDEMQKAGELPFISVSLIKNIGPSKLNSGETGEQKTIVIGNVKRAFFGRDPLARVVREYVFEDMLHTKLVGRVVADMFRARQPGKPEAFYETIRDVVGDAQQILALSTEDKEECYKIVNDTISLYASDEDFIANAKEYDKKSNKKNAVLGITNALEKMSKTVTIRGINGDIANFGRMSTDKKYRSVYGGMYIAHSFGVTPYHDDVNYFNASDTYMEKLRRMVGGNDKDVRDGAAFLSTETLNSYVVLEQYFRDQRAVLRNLMSYRNADNEESWTEAINYLHECNANIFDAFVKCIPSGNRRRSYTNCEPSAVLVRFSNAEPYDAGSCFINPVTGANAEEEACQRLADFSGKSPFDSPKLKKDTYWVCKNESIKIPEDVKTSTVTDLYSMMQNGYALK